MKVWQIIIIIGLWKFDRLFKVYEGLTDYYYMQVYESLTDYYYMQVYEGLCGNQTF